MLTGVEDIARSPREPRLDRRQGTENLVESSEQLELGMRFGAALAAMDEETLRDVCTEDVTWSIPGSGPISGTSFGVAGLIAVQRLFSTGATAWSRCCMRRAAKTAKLST